MEEKPISSTLPIDNRQYKYFDNINNAATRVQNTRVAKRKKSYLGKRLSTQILIIPVLKQQVCPRRLLLGRIPSRWQNAGGFTYTIEFLLLLL